MLTPSTNSRTVSVGNTTRIIWSYSGVEVFGLWSVNHENFCVMAEHERNFRLVRISDKKSASINLGGVYVGGPWVGHRKEIHIDRTLHIGESNFSAYTAGVSKIDLS